MAYCLPIHKGSQAADFAESGTRSPRPQAQALLKKPFPGYVPSALAHKVMLCERCHEREATVHLTSVMGDEVTKTDFCEECFRSVGSHEANEAFSVFHYGCFYCGGQVVAGTAPPPGAGNEQQTIGLCRPCWDEMHAYILRTVPDLGGKKPTPELIAEKLTPEQLAEALNLQAKVHEHMRKWVSWREGGDAVGPS